MSNVTLVYVIREYVDVPYDCPVLAPGKPYSVEFKSIEGDIINIASHTNGIFRDDSVDVY